MVIRVVGNHLSWVYFLQDIGPKQQAKKMRLLGRIREGYNALNSEEESCISRVAAILAITVK